ncbi:hypothetical protein U370_00880 [Anaplasma marginale str. Dawn]|nr:hypothetical protein U370_00880 [Anaplasma marginale str. Dawn]
MAQARCGGFLAVPSSEFLPKFFSGASKNINYNPRQLVEGVSVP